MNQASRGQRTALAVLGIVLAIVFIGLIVYYTGFAKGHPHIKHDVLFAVLTVASLLLAWFSWPSARSTRS